jgi:hypothetical protein
MSTRMILATLSLAQDHPRLVSTGPSHQWQWMMNDVLVVLLSLMIPPHTISNCHGASVCHINIKGKRGGDMV